MRCFSQVHEHPRLTSHSEAIEGVEGESLTVNCKATGKPPPEYKWMNQDNVDLSQGSQPRYRVDRYEGTLFISDLKKKEDEGL